MSTGGASNPGTAARTTNMTGVSDSSGRPVRSKFTDIEEWIRTQMEKEALEVAQMPAKSKKTKSARRAAAAGSAPTKAAQTPTSEEVTENWVGQLQEYLVAKGPSLSQADFAFTQLPGLLPAFICVLTLHETLAPHPFPVAANGSPPRAFANKKAAKQHAAKCAMEWLSSQPASTTTAAAAAPATSYGAQVSAACARLGLPPPQYVVEPHDSFAAIWSGYAHFGNDPRVLGRIGEFHNVYGRKKAREECARLVLSFLLGMEELRRRVGSAA